MPLLADAEAVYVGDLPADRVYLGELLVWSASRLDPDTQRYLDASGLDVSFAPALDGLVTGLKGAGLWQKMTAVYPFIGGTEALHKWNLIDPRDADDAYRLTYAPGSGGHSEALGYKPNAAPDSGGGCADTHLVPSTTLDPASVHLSLYSLTPLANAPRCDMGAYNWGGTGGRFHLIVHYTTGEFYYSLGHGGTPAIGQPGSGDGSGLFVSSRTDITSETAYRNGAALGSSGIGGGVMPPIPVLIGALNAYPREHSDLPFGFASIGSGLTAQNVADLNVVVEAYQDALGRGVQAHVWTPEDIPGLVAWIDPAQDTFADGQPIAEYREHANGLVFTADSRPEYQPIFRAGGNPYLDFHSQCLGFTSALQRTWHDGATFISLNSVTGGTVPMMVVVGTDPNGLEMRHNGSGLECVIMYTSTSMYFSHPTPSSHTPTVYAMRVGPGASATAWTNDEPYSYGMVGAMLPEPQTTYIGRRQGGYYFVGPIYETLVYDGPVSDADMALLRDYLTTKHGLPRRYW